MKSYLIGCMIFTIAFLPVYSSTTQQQYFFVSDYQPKYSSLNLGMLRILVWHPWPFVSISIGRMQNNSPKFRALQIYFGIKCDGTRTTMIGGAPPCVMVLTPKELTAVRITNIDRIPVWNNQGGA